MYGLVHIDDDEAYFIKMTGPRDVLAAEEANFLAFSASVQQGEAAPATAVAPATESAPASSNPHAPAVSEAPMTESTLEWAAPEGWQDAGPRMMREVTFTAGDVECYVAMLPGDAGGVEANINRWVGQMGQPALESAAITALPTIAFMGQQAPLVEVSGDYTDMQGAQKSNYKMMGTLVATGTHMVFVKMTGPGTEVDAQKDKFIAFCASIRARGAA